jgi:hypothetical protein
MPPQHDAAPEATLLLEQAPLYVQTSSQPRRRLRPRDALTAFALGLAAPSAYTLVRVAVAAAG